MKQFLKAVWGKTEGWAFVGAKRHDDTGDWKQKAYKYPTQLDNLIRDVTDWNKHSSIYFCPHLFQDGSSRRVKDNSQPTHCLWIDKDAGKLDEIEPKPTFCWQTSTGKWQALWMLNEPLELDKAELINKRLIYTTKADKGGWHAGKYLRIPNSLNHKYSPPFQGIKLWDNGPSYDASDFIHKEHEEAIIAAQELIGLDRMPDRIPTFTEAILKYGNKISSTVWGLLSANPRKTDSWSESLWRLETLLIKAEIPLDCVFAIAKGSPWNKYERDGRPDEHLWKEVCKAAQEKGVLIPEEDLEELPWTTLDSLLLHAERPTWLVEDVWMAKNVGWIAGEGKSYKSVLSLDLALSIASGTPFLGKFPVKDPGAVLMVQEEDPIWRVAHRIQAMAEQKNIYNMDVKGTDSGLVLRVKDTNVPLYVAVGGRLTFDNEDKMNALERAIESKRPKMVLLDPMFMLSAGMDEFKASEMTTTLNTLKHWRNEYDCAIAIVHHYRKSTGVDTQKLYGSMALYAWSENSLLVQRESREANVVSIRRDIKDAPSDEKLAVEFFDIDATYNFKLADKYVPSETEQDKVIQCFVHNKGVELTIKDIQEMTNLNPKTIRKHVYTMKDEHKVNVKRGGRGGVQKFIMAKDIIDSKYMPEEECF